VLTCSKSERRGVRKRCGKRWGVEKKGGGEPVGQGGVMLTPSSEKNPQHGEEKKKKETKKKKPQIKT